MPRDFSARFRLLSCIQLCAQYIKFIESSKPSDPAFFDARKSMFQKSRFLAGLLKVGRQERTDQTEIYGKGFVANKRFSVKASAEKTIENVAGK